MVSIAHKVPMYIVLLSRRILNSHWMKTVTGTTPIGPSIEAHLYPWVFEEILSLSLSLSLSRSLSPFLLLYLSFSSPISFLLLFLPFPLSLFFTPCFSSFWRDEASVCFRQCMHTCVSTDTRRERESWIYMHDSLHFDSLSLSFPLSLYLSMQFSPLLWLAHLFLPLHYDFLFASVFWRREKQKYKER